MQMNQPLDPTPPHGTWFRRYPDRVEFGAFTKSYGAVPSVLYMLIWNGANYYAIFFVVNFTLLDVLCFMPFMVAGLYGMKWALQCGFGHVAIVINKDVCTAFSRLGCWGKLHRINLTDIEHVEADGNYGVYGFWSSGIQVLGLKTIRFGRLLAGEKREFVLNTMDRFIYEFKNRRESQVLQSSPSAPSGKSLGK